MPLEPAGTPDSLVVSNPTDSDYASQLGAHIRLIKSALLEVFTLGQFLIPGPGPGGLTGIAKMFFDDISINLTNGPGNLALNSSGVVTLSGPGAGVVVGTTPLLGVPLGGIILSAGFQALPPGFAVCNGSNGTPNLTSSVPSGATNYLIRTS